MLRGNEITIKSSVDARLISVLEFAWANGFSIKAISVPRKYKRQLRMLRIKKINEPVDFVDSDYGILEIHYI